MSDKVTVMIDSDEDYPVYFLYEGDVPEDYLGTATKVDVSAETAERWRRVESEYRTMQREMRKASGDEDEDDDFVKRLLPEENRAAVERLIEAQQHESSEEDMRRRVRPDGLGFIDDDV